MMSRAYSVYEAKAKLSEILRHVRETGDSATISYHGDPIAEIRPVAVSNDEIEKKLDALERRGVLAPPRVLGAKFPPAIARRPGALARFLRERDV
jgi:prevent-host-death family protein